MFKRRPGLFKRRPGLFKRRPGLLKRRPEKHKNANNFVVFELLASGKKIYVTTTYSASESAKKVLLRTPTLIQQRMVFLTFLRRDLLYNIFFENQHIALTDIFS